MIAAFCIVVGLAAILLLLMVALVGWGGETDTRTRAGLAIVLAGLCWAGPDRFLGKPPGLGDLLFLSGLIIHVWSRYGAEVLRRLDLLDGDLDGRLRPPSPAKRKGR